MNAWQTRPKDYFRWRRGSLPIDVRGFEFSGTIVVDVANNDSPENLIDPTSGSSYQISFDPSIGQLRVTGENNDEIRFDLARHVRTLRQNTAKDGSDRSSYLDGVGSNFRARLYPEILHVKSDGGSTKIQFIRILVLIGRSETGR